jgi:protease-4
MSERSLLGRIARSYALIVLIGLLVGVAMAPAAWQASTTTTTDGTVAVVPVEGSIDGNSAASLDKRLERARSDGSIEAVVLVSNSFGGSAVASESQYLDVKRTAETMPVVTSVGAAATSGAYFTTVPSDYIFAKPSSLVGHVGVVTTRPPDVEPNRRFVTTGPKKLTGMSQRDLYYWIESGRLVFSGAVFEQRGENITISKAEVSEARMFPGPEAVETGLADEIGTRDQAIRKAAAMADLESYDVEVIRREAGVPSFLSRSTYLASGAPEKSMAPPGHLVGRERTGGPIRLMVSPQVIEPPAPAKGGNRSGNTEVIVDGR